MIAHHSKDWCHYCKETKQHLVDIVLTNPSTGADLYTRFCSVCVGLMVDALAKGITHATSENT